MQFVVKPLAIEAINEIIAIENQSQFSPWSEGIIRSCFSARYLNLAMFDTHNNKLVGYLFSDHIAGEISLMNICIAPDYRRQGLAELLVTQLIEQGQQLKAETVWLEVRESNRAAQKLYDKLGFNEIAVRANYYPTKQGMEDAIVMSLYIG